MMTQYAYEELKRLPKRRVRARINILNNEIRQIKLQITKLRAKFQLDQKEEQERLAAEEAQKAHEAEKEKEKEKKELAATKSSTLANNELTGGDGGDPVVAGDAPAQAKTEATPETETNANPETTTTTTDGEAEVKAEGEAGPDPAQTDPEVSDRTDPNSGSKAEAEPDTKAKEEMRIDPSDGQPYSKSSFVEAYGGTAEWDAATVHDTADAAPERRLDPSDGQPYTQASFVQAYGGTAEWDAAEVFKEPEDEEKLKDAETEDKNIKDAEAEEKRLDPSDGLPYTKASFLEVYGGEEEWNTATVFKVAKAEEKRIDPHDGQPYNQASFIEVYGSLIEWEKATVWEPPLPKAKEEAKEEVSGSDATEAAAKAGRKDSPRGGEPTVGKSTGKAKESSKSAKVSAKASAKAKSKSKSLVTIVKKKKKKKIVSDDPVEMLLALEQKKAKKKKKAKAKARQKARAEAEAKLQAAERQKEAEEKKKAAARAKKVQARLESAKLEVASPTGQPEPSSAKQPAKPEQSDEAVAKLREELARMRKLPLPPKIPNKNSVRNYVNQCLDPELDKKIVPFLQKLHEFQRRLYAKDPAKAKRRRRLVMGLREVKRDSLKNKLECCIVCPNIDEGKRTGGLDDQVKVAIDNCRVHGIPVIFGLSRRKLGRALKKGMRISCVGVLDASGAHKEMKDIVAHAEALCKEFGENGGVHRPHAPAPTAKKKKKKKKTPPAASASSSSAASAASASAASGTDRRTTAPSKRKSKPKKRVFQVSLSSASQSFTPRSIPHSAAATATPMATPMATPEGQTANAVYTYVGWPPHSLYSSYYYDANGSANGGSAQHYRQS